MNMIAETVIHDVSDPCHSARHAVRRDPPPTGSAWDESDYWMGLSIRYGRDELACLLAAMALSSIGVAAGMALSVLFLVPSALLVVLLVAAGLWCRGNSLDARDLSVWSMGGTPAEEGGEWK